MILSGLLLIIALYIFSKYFLSSKQSPIPYFPTQKKDIVLLKKNLYDKEPYTFIDLGAGSGTVVFALAESDTKGINKFIAFEKNPVLVLIMYMLLAVNINKYNIRIVLGDMFTYSLSGLLQKNTTPIFYLYISPWLIDNVIKNIKKTVNKGIIISYMYPIKNKRAFKKIHGINSFYFYNV